MRFLILFILSSNLFAKDIYYKIKGSPQVPPCYFQWYETVNKKQYRTAENCTEEKIEKSIESLLKEDITLIEY
jgi:hypothetical protein